MNSHKEWKLGMLLHIAGTRKVVIDLQTFDGLVSTWWCELEVLLWNGG